MNSISKITVVPVRQAFRHEAHNFTVWLEENIDALSERIGIDLNVIEREKSVGSFNVDLFCDDGNENYAIIENQLEKTDHDHLGKLMTYLINLDATIAIWVATEIRPEHQRVIDWLNEMSSADYAFYAVQVEAIRIGDSPFAPLFTVLSQPDEQTRKIGEQKKELAGTPLLQHRFWEGLLSKADRHSPFANISPQKQNWISAGAGKTGLGFNFVIKSDDARAELYIDAGEYEQNKVIFDTLHAQREAIEQEFGDELDWQRLDDKRASRIAYTIQGHGLKAEDQWDQLQQQMLETMKRLEGALRNRIARLNV